MIFSLYRRFISPYLHRLSAITYSPLHICRYSPTCSAYAATAIAKYGIIHGSILGLKRILRCHPFSRHPYSDPVK